MPYGQKKKQNMKQKQYCNKFNKDSLSLCSWYEEPTKFCGKPLPWPFCSQPSAKPSRHSLGIG